MNPTSPIVTQVTRRSFVQKTTAGVAGGVLLGALAPDRFALGAPSTDELKIALIGCGGRGGGAADQALSTYEQGPVKLVALGDVHEDRLNSTLQNLEKKHGARVDVPKDRQFLGFDAYLKAIETADVVILATPPGFRPMMFEAAVKAGKNVFSEKPVATDAAGVRIFLAAAEEAKKKNLKVGIGLQRHHQDGYIETIKRLQDGQIGDISSMRAYWNGNRPWQKHRADLEKQYGRELTELEYQMRNWYYFGWICGDHIDEQHIHNLDVINWLKNAHPVKARAMGGREITNTPDDGNIYDHFACQFEYEDGSIMYSECRHQPGCWNSVSEHAQGSKGRSDINRYVITGADQWRFKKEGAKDPYQQEHDALFAAIRNNTEHNEAVYGAESTMTALLGRMCAYSGKELEWKQALESKVELFPFYNTEGKIDWNADPGPKPGKDGYYERPVPGKTEVV